MCDAIVPCTKARRLSGLAYGGLAILAPYARLKAACHQTAAPQGLCLAACQEAEAADLTKPSTAAIAAVARCMHCAGATYACPSAQRRAEQANLVACASDPRFAEGHQGSGNAPLYLLPEASCSSAAASGVPQWVVALIVAVSVCGTFLAFFLLVVRGEQWHLQARRTASRAAARQAAHFRFQREGLDWP